MSSNVIAWRILKCSGLRGPAYVDLGALAAVLPTRPPAAAADTAAPELAVELGASIYLTGGQVFYVKETAEAIFEEWHRYRTEAQPQPPPMKLSAAAPAANLGIPCVHLGCGELATERDQGGRPYCAAHAADSRLLTVAITRAAAVGIEP